MPLHVCVLSLLVLHIVPTRFFPLGISMNFFPSYQKPKFDLRFLVSTVLLLYYQKVYLESRGDAITFKYKTTIFNVADMFRQKLVPSPEHVLHKMQI